MNSVDNARCFLSEQVYQELPCAAQIAVREDVAYRIADVCYCRNHLVENDKSSVTEHPAYDFAHLVQIVP